MATQMFGTASDYPVFGECALIVDIIENEPRHITDIKAQIDSELTQDDIATANKGRFDHSIQWLANDAIIEVDNNQMVSLIHDGGLAAIQR